MDKQFYLDEIRRRLSPKRYRHSVNVAKAAAALAKRYGADPARAELAGILHDITKETETAVQLQIIRDFGIILNVVEQSSYKLLHAISAFCLVQETFGLQDEQVLGAIRYHTTARAAMPLLEKVVYVADFISDDRDYQGVEVMRRRAEESLEAAMFEGLAYTIRDLAGRGLPIHLNTVEAFNDIVYQRPGEQPLLR